MHFHLVKYNWEATSGDTHPAPLETWTNHSLKPPRVWELLIGRCKGRTYGTDKGRPRSPQNRSTCWILVIVQPLRAWLTDHPSIEIVSRDRSKEYAKAITSAAPAAEQRRSMASVEEPARGKATEKLLLENPACLHAAATIRNSVSAIPRQNKEEERLCKIHVYQQPRRNTYQPIAHDRYSSTFTEFESRLTKTTIRH